MNNSNARPTASRGQALSKKETIFAPKMLTALSWPMNTRMTTTAATVMRMYQVVGERNVCQTILAILGMITARPAMKAAMQM